MRTRPSTILVGILGTAALGVAAAAQLKHTAPAKVDLTGLWKINADLSDDPYEAADDKRQKNAERPFPGSGRGGPVGGGVGGGPGGVVVDAGDVLGEIFGRAMGKTSGGGTARGDRPEGDPEPAAARMPLDSFLATREQFEITQQPDSLTITTADEEITCKPDDPGKAPVPGGDLGDRRCGWRGDTWVSEVTAPDDVTRTNRYELKKGGQQLVVISEIKGRKSPLSGLRVKRVYDRLLLN